MLIGFSATAIAQTPTTNVGLQGDAILTTAGNWVHPAAPGNNPMPAPIEDLPPEIEAVVQLGKALFWDEQVSTDNTMACGTCHIPGAGGIDPRPPGLTFIPAQDPEDPLQAVLGSSGVLPQSQPTVGPGEPIDYGISDARPTTPIHVPTMIGAYVFRNQFWDLRAGESFTFTDGEELFPQWASLENQAVGPPASAIEMGHENLSWSLGIIQAKLNDAAPLALATDLPSSIPMGVWGSKSYAWVFDTVFAATPDPRIATQSGVTRERFAMAVASYVRTLVPDRAPIDTSTMTEDQRKGFDIFIASGCATCHSVTGAANPPRLVNRGEGGTPGFSNIGRLSNRWNNPFSDGVDHDVFFLNTSRRVGPVKTPTLRNVGLRSRFFHDGQGRIVDGVATNTIEAIVDFYDIDQSPNPNFPVPQPGKPPGPGGVFELHGSGEGDTLTAEERDQVIAFLRDALTDPRVRDETPPFDRPTLYSERVPFGTNVMTATHPPTAAGAAQELWLPSMIANVPPLREKVGGPSQWKVGVGTTPGAMPIPPGTGVALWGSCVPPAANGPFYLQDPSVVHLVTSVIGPNGFFTAHGPGTPGAIPIGLEFYVQWIVFDVTVSPAQVGYSSVAKLTSF